MARTWPHVTRTSAVVSGAAAHTAGAAAAVAIRSRPVRGPGASPVSSCASPGRVAHLVQQDDGSRHPRHRAAIDEGHRCRSDGPAGQAGTAGEGCRGPHGAPDDHDERRPVLLCGGDDRHRHHSGARGAADSRVSTSTLARSGRTTTTVSMRP